MIYTATTFGKQRSRVRKILIVIVSKRHRLQGMSNNTFQSTKKTTEPFTPPQLQKGTGRTTRFEWSELWRRQESIWHLLKAKRWHWRQQAAAAGTGTVTFQHSHMLQVLPFPSSHAQKDNEGHRRRSRIYLCYLHTHTLFILLSISSSSSSAEQDRAQGTHRQQLTARAIIFQLWEGYSTTNSLPPPQKGQSCFTHLIFGRTGSAVTFPTNKKTSQIRSFTFQQVLHLHWKHILSFIIKAAGKVTNWVILYPLLPKQLLDWGDFSFIQLPNC